MDEYTEEQMEVIKQYWVGEPPACCKGNCELVDGFGCVWCKC